MGCKEDNPKFSEPMPWIGLYIAAASLLSSLLMGLDTFYGFRRRKLWFPCRFFSLNATSLTLLSIATKVPVDLNTFMPRNQDQLTKLSGTVLICTVMGNFMTSLGTMGGSEMVANVLALGILVVVVIVNIGIQMSTGVIYVFLPEHAVIMFLMIVLLVMLCSTAITAPTAKKLLDAQYDKIHSRIHDQGPCESNIKKLREDVKKYWMMAHTCSPQYVVGRSATSTASGAFCLLSALVLLQAAVRSLIFRSLHFCKGKSSDYTWSVTLILVSQAIAIAVGTIAPAIRWFNAISFRSRPKSWKQSCKGKEFKVEKYWLHRLEGWKEGPLHFHTTSRRFRKIFHVSRIQVLNVFIGMQFAVVKASKLIRLTSILLVSWLTGLYCCCKRLGRKSKESESEFGSGSGSNVDLSICVLHLDGEEDLVRLIMTNGREDTERWIKGGKSNQPNYLKGLLEKTNTMSQDFQGVEEFDSVQVPSLLGTQLPPPNCWALPMVTLTSIAIAIAPLTQIEKEDIELLRCGVHEGLEYVRLVEKNLDDRGLINMRKAADIVWLSIDIYDRWLDTDLKKLASAENNVDRILEKLAQIGENYVSDYATESERAEHPRDWSPKISAANSMYRLCTTILRKKRRGTSDETFIWLRKMITDILYACLTNLPRVISMECYCTSIETREERVRDAAFRLGEAEFFLTKQEMDTCPGKKTVIDDWILRQTEEPVPVPSSS